MINIGDRVKFLSDTGVGHVTRIEGGYVYVDMEDGFEIPALITDVVVVNEEDELEAMARIGMSDEKPGRKKKNDGNKHADKKRPSTKDPAYRRYGKISLVDTFTEDDEENDDDMVPDVLELKEKYLKNLALRREREAQMDQSRLKQQQEKERTTQAGTVRNVLTNPSQTDTEKEKKSQEKGEANKRDLSQELSTAMMGGAKNIENPKKEKSEIEVVDLHAEEVLGETEGLTSGQILDAQMARYTFTLDSLVNSKKHGKIVFIHGVGKGKLKYEMLKVLKRDYPKMDYQDASFKEYGYGAIIVYY